jgi:hypothetical protein
MNKKAWTNQLDLRPILFVVETSDCIHKMMMGGGAHKIFLIYFKVLYFLFFKKLFLILTY